jgi:hypothetical protein
MPGWQMLEAAAFATSRAVPSRRKSKHVARARDFQVEVVDKRQGDRNVILHARVVGIGQDQAAPISELAAITLAGEVHQFPTALPQNMATG